uniref:ZP domain-containing protein n=1 Tax=Plectus sambesii TaxID=2011161 RepID=A0A914UXG6_9BILA
IGPQKGVEQSMTVIISFHDTFITKVDRAYRCTCFFMEADKVVTSRFEVSMLPTTDLLDTARMPLCTYNVRRGSITGAPVAYATVGEEVYHVWRCDSDMFGMLVHSCFVDDGSGGERKQLLDEQGCAIDQVILPDLAYNQQSNMAYAEVHVFKFADKVTTYFQCAITICMRSDGACNGVTPPSCRGSQSARNRTRFARDSADMPPGRITENESLPSREINQETDMDVSADRIVVLDLDDRTSPTTAALENKENVILDPLDWRSGPSIHVMEASARQVCLSTSGFGVVLSVFVLILMASISGIGALYMRHRQQPPLKP